MRSDGSTIVLWHEDSHIFVFTLMLLMIIIFILIILIIYFVWNNKCIIHSTNYASIWRMRETGEFYRNTSTPWVLFTRPTICLTHRLAVLNLLQVHISYQLPPHYHYLCVNMPHAQGGSCLLYTSVSFWQVIKYEWKKTANSSDF